MVLWVARQILSPAPEREPARMAARMLAICHVERSMTSRGAWSSLKLAAQWAAV